MEGKHCPLPPSLLSSVIVKYDGERSESDGSFHSFHGEGRAEFHDGSEYMGAFFKSKMHGNGKFVWVDGTVYRGNFDFNRIDGEGNLTWTDKSSYTGDFKDGQRHGTGVYAFEDMRYEGEWQNSKRHGNGRLTQGKSVYEGNFVDGKREGRGKMTFENGDEYEGDFVNDTMEGFGTMKWTKSHETYSGQWKAGNPHGKGQYVWRDGEGPHVDNNNKVLSRTQMCNHYEGSFVEGKRNGFGVFWYSDGSRYQGQWKNDKKEGEGVYTFSDGRVYTGKFVEDRMLDPEPEMDAQHKGFGSIGVDLQVKDLIPDVGPKVRRIIREVENVLLRHNASLREIYMKCVHCKSGQLENEKTELYTLRGWQFWMFCTLCDITDETITLGVLNRTLQHIRKVHGQQETDLEQEEKVDVHDPYQSILFREFVEALVRLAFLKYSIEHPDDSLAFLVSRLINSNVLKFQETEVEPTQAVIEQYATPPASDIKTAFNSCSIAKDPVLLDVVSTPRNIITILRYAKIVDPTGQEIIFPPEAEQPNVEEEKKASCLGEGEVDGEAEANKEKQEDGEEADGELVARPQYWLSLSARNSLTAILKAILPKGLVQQNKASNPSYLDNDILSCQFPSIVEHLTLAAIEQNETLQDVPSEIISTRLKQALQNPFLY